jgi:hypothetical protein
MPIFQAWAAQVAEPVVPERVDFIPQPGAPSPVEALPPPATEVPAPPPAAVAPEPVPPDEPVPAPTIDPEREQRRAERRAEARKRLRARHESEDQLPARMKPFEVVLAVLLVLALVTGLGAASWRLYRAERPDAPVAEAEPVEPAEPAVERLWTPLPLPPAQRLIGVWEMRADDGRQGWMEFRANSTATIAASMSGVPSSSGDPQGEIRLERYWFVREETGDQLVIDLCEDPTGLDSLRITLVLTSPDALTFTESIMRGIVMREPVRYVRALLPAPTGVLDGIKIGS